MLKFPKFPDSNLQVKYLKHVIQVRHQSDPHSEVLHELRNFCTLTLKVQSGEEWHLRKQVPLKVEQQRTRREARSS